MNKKYAYRTLAVLLFLGGSAVCLTGCSSSGNGYGGSSPSSGEKAPPPPKKD